MFAHRLKTLARNGLPARLQVPVKYHYGVLRGDIEPEMALLPDLIRQGDHAIDVGGNRGTYAYRLSKLGARLDVFEPNPVCASLLRQWAASRSGVEIHAVALSASAGTAQLHVPVDEHGVQHDASATIEEGHDTPSHDYEVPLRSLDSFGFRDARLIKIDVEGHESSVLSGAAETLKASRPALLVEIEQRHNGLPIDEIFKQIEARGYSGFFLLNGRLAELSIFDLDIHQPITAFERGSGSYHNNFLFLSREEIAAGRYAALLRRWAAR